VASGASLDGSRDRWWVSTAFLLALAVRLSPLPAASAGGLRLLSPDCYGHLRRATSVARNFPRVPIVDPYLNPPDGGVWIWPPAFDLLIGGTARLLFGAGVVQDDVARVAAALPPLLGAFHVVPLFALARRVFGRRRARLAVAAYSVMPAAVVWSCYGHADHHVAEALVLLVFLWAAAAAACARGAARMRLAVAAGAALAAAILTWQGAVFIGGLGLPWAAMFLGPAALAVGVTSTLLTALAAWLTVGGLTVPFSFVSWGWFQPLLLAAGTLVLVLLAAATAKERRGRLAAIAAALLLSVFVVPALPRLASAVFRGGAYVVRQEPAVAGQDDFADGGFLSYPADFLHVVAEAQPLLKAPAASSLPRAVRELSPGLLLLPLALAVWARGARRRLPGRTAARLLVAAFGAALLLMTLLQSRNVYYLAIFTALALGDAFARLGALAARWRVRASLAAAAALALTVLAVVLPGRPVLARIAAYGDAPGHDVLNLLTRLRDFDPPPVDPASLPPPAPGRVASVMAPWAAGHFVTALVARPAAADPLVYGWRRQCRLFTSRDPEEALAILRRARCKYLVTTDLRPVLAHYAAAAGNAPTPLDTMFSVRVHESGDVHPFPFLTRVLDSRSAARRADGSFLPRFRVFRVDGVSD
jgi:asparagine N-glycosylation enzyme membrane subunit Stt3